MGTLNFSSPATVSGRKQLALCNGVEEGGEEESIEDVEAIGVRLARRPWFGVTGPDGGGEHVPVFGGRSEALV